MNTPQRYNWAGNSSRKAKPRISPIGRAILIFEWAIVSCVAILVAIAIERALGHILYAVIGGILALAALAGAWRLFNPGAFTGR
jgi:hypothetical protein